MMASAAFGGELTIEPSQVTLHGNFSQSQLLVREADSTGIYSERSVDHTARAAFQSLTPEIVQVSPSGCLTAVNNGSGKVSVTVDGKVLEIAVDVQGVTAEPTIDFHRDLLPLITRAGCNAGSCHASQYGKGGLVLSVMAFDPPVDYQSLAVGARGRRINTSNPA
ncbi:MAG: hypothetical protein ACK6DC_13530 [Planctomycetota bacterium]